MDSEKISAKLRELRESKGLTQTEVADSLGISHSAYCMYEKGDRIPRDNIKIKIAGFYKKTVQYIFYAL